MQISILSGKGGSGKTSLTAALISLIQQEFPITLVDADVDASNLELVIPAQKELEEQFFGGQIAQIDDIKCIGCGDCERLCRFHAIVPNRLDNSNSSGFTVNSMKCEGCTVCAQHCPQQAIEMKPSYDGDWFRSNTNYGTLFHAHLFAGHENSGKLVSTILHNAKEYDSEKLIIVDGPPGIGCPVIAVCTQSDHAIIVTEPSVSGIHDLERILETTQHFRLPSYVVINKADLNTTNCKQIEELCRSRDIPILGEIPFDSNFNSAMINAQPITIHAPTSPSSQALCEIWHNLKQILTL